MALSLREKLEQGFRANAAAKISPLPEKQHESIQAVDAKIGHLNGAPQRGRTTGQDNGAGQQGTSTGQEGRTTGHLNGAGGQDNRAGQRGTSTGQDNGAPQRGRTTGHLNRAGQRGTSTGQDNRAPQQGTSTGAPILIDQPHVARTPAQRRVYGYLEKYGNHVSNYKKIIEETGLPYNTVRKCIDKFVVQGILTKTPWSQGSARGLFFDFHPQTGQDNGAGQRGTSTGQDNGAGQRGTSYNVEEIEDRERKDLSISLKKISLYTTKLAWPTLAQCGFGPEQLAQIEITLTEQGKSLERVVQGLDHAEWELANNVMLDKQGESVADPCAWVFRSLAQTGYYRRPKKYVSPEEQADLDRATEARARARSREEARQARFEAWVSSLSVEDKKTALEGCQGPKTPWLKNAWIKRGEPDGA